MSAGEHRHRRDGRVRLGHGQGQLTAAAAPPAEEAGGASRHYWLRPSIEVVPAGGDLYLLRPGEGEDLAVRSPDEADHALLDVLGRGPATEPQLRELLAGGGLEVDLVAVRGKLGALLDADAVVSFSGELGRLDPQDSERFARQLPYFAEHGDPAVAQRRLREARVVVLGCGGLGTWVVAALASMGVGALMLIDDDRVELSNLNRQILFGTDDLGGAKAVLAADWVGRFDPAISVRAVERRISGPEDLAPLLSGADVLVHAADSPPYELERWVNAACIAEGVAWVTAGQSPPILRLGPTYIPGTTACFTCHERHLAREHELWPEVVRARSARPVVATTLGPASGLLGSLIGLQVLDLLTSPDLPATAGHALLIDMATLAMRRGEVPRDPGCPACGAA